MKKASLFPRSFIIQLHYWTFSINACFNVRNFKTLKNIFFLPGAYTVSIMGPYIRIPYQPCANLDLTLVKFQGIFESLQHLNSMNSYRMHSCMKWEWDQKYCMCVKYVTTRTLYCICDAHTLNPYIYPTSIWYRHSKLHTAQLACRQAASLTGYQCNSLPTCRTAW